jgi:predicted ATPase
VKLVNRGVQVWITTHSDTMFQQFNNLIGSTEKRIQKLKNLSYQDDEIIKPEDIKAYQFNIEDGKTDVVPLEQTENGLVAPTFNKAIIELSEEAIHLEAGSEDAD